MSFLQNFFNRYRHPITGATGEYHKTHLPTPGTRDLAFVPDHGLPGISFRGRGRLPQGSLMATFQPTVINAPFVTVAGIPITTRDIRFQSIQDNPNDPTGGQ